MSPFDTRTGKSNMPNETGLSENSFTILKYIAEGHSYDQILKVYPDLTYQDISFAAQEALAALNGKTPPVNSRERKIIELRKRYPRAHRRWTQQEDNQLATLFSEGQSVHDIANTIGRNPSAIRRRMKKLGLSVITNDGDIPRVMVQNIDEPNTH